MCAECFDAPECYACVVGVATGPESHSPCCRARNIPMPVQDGSFGPEWDEWEQAVAAARQAPQLNADFVGNNAVIRRNDGKTARRHDCQ